MTKPDDICADCGLERREHHHDGAAYGRCGQFSEVAHARLSAGSEQAIEFEYTNWEGRKGIRQAIPISIRFGKSEWHDVPQWLMLAYDIDKQAEREYAMADMQFDGEFLPGIDLKQSGDVAQPAAKPYGWAVERPGDPTFPRLYRTKAEADAVVEYVNVNPPATARPLYDAPVQSCSAGSEGVSWRRVNGEPFEYAIQQGQHGDEFVKLLDGKCLRRPIGGEEVPVECWHETRKVTVYRDEVLRVWGQNMGTEMSSEARSLETVQSAMDWLYAAEPQAVSRLTFCETCNGNTMHRRAAIVGRVQTFECQRCALSQETGK